jgi:group I intron endonuclease
MFVVYETYKIDEPEKNYIGKTYREKIERGYTGSGKLICKAIEKYGKRVFSTRILAEVVDEDEAYSLEEKIIEEKKPYYNMCDGGRGKSKGLKDSPEVKQKKSLARMGDKNPMWGKKKPETSAFNTRTKKKPIEDKRLYEMRKQGMYFRDIGAVVGLSASNVYERLRKYNG